MSWQAKSRVGSAGGAAGQVLRAIAMQVCDHVIGCMARVVGKIVLVCLVGWSARIVPSLLERCWLATGLCRWLCVMDVLRVTVGVLLTGRKWTRVSVM